MPDATIHEAENVRDAMACLKLHDVAVMFLDINLASSFSEKQDMFDQLTRREFDVFMGVAKGQKRNRIALDLNISDKTVSNAITQLKNKLQVKTSTELVHLAIENGYVKVAK